MIKTEIAFECVRLNQTDKLKKLLFDEPALAAQSNEENISLLLYAIYYRRKKAVALISSYKKTISVYEAACLGDLIVLERELEKDASLLNAFSTDGFTLLGYACFFGQEKASEYLIGRGANVNVASSNHFRVCPIHSATAISNFYLVKLLIEHGANVNARQQGGFTPLHSAVMNKATNIEVLLLEYYADELAKNEVGKTPLDYRPAS